MNKHFPSGDKLYKIYKNNALKLSYSCMPNLNAKIDGHNKIILETSPPPKKKIMQTAWKKKVVPGEEPASLKIFYTSLE